MVKLGMVNPIVSPFHDIFCFMKLVPVLCNTTEFLCPFKMGTGARKQTVRMPEESTIFFWEVIDGLAV